MQTITTTTSRTIGKASLFLGISPLLPAIGLMHLVATLDGGESKKRIDRMNHNY